MKRNARLLNKTAGRIESIPQSYDQETFYRESDESPCGAAACLGGEIIICSERSPVKGIQKLNEIMARGRVEGCGLLSKAWPGWLAASLAGLNDREAEQLFFNGDGSGWPNKFRRQFERARTPKGKAGVAARLLRYLAEGGEV